MRYSKVRRQIAWLAARLVYTRQETNLVRAKLAAARQVVRGWVPPAEMPSLVEIREQLDRLTQLADGGVTEWELPDQDEPGERTWRGPQSFSSLRIAALAA